MTELDRRKIFRSPMQLTWALLVFTIILVTILFLTWIDRSSSSIELANNNSKPSIDPALPAFHLGIIPERNIFAQRKRYLALAGYLEMNLNRRTELVTDNTYLAVLKDYAKKQLDGAFLGSLVAVLSMDRFGAKVCAKPVTTNGVSTYRGVIFVRADSSIHSLNDLAGKTIAMVRATTAGDLYPMYEMKQHNLLHADNQPIITWMGTHDTVIREVAEGNFDAGAAKDLRLDAYSADPNAVPIRRLAIGPAVPNNALVLSAQVTEDEYRTMTDLLLHMDSTPEGRSVLAQLGFNRFIPCKPSEYRPVMDMIDALGADWDVLEIDGDRPNTFREKYLNDKHNNEDK